MKDHPFTSANGIDCDWCTLPEPNRVHIPPPMVWDDDGSTALVTGWVMMALHQSVTGTIVQSVEPLLDQDNNYTNKVRITTNAGNVYDVTVTRNT